MFAAILALFSFWYTALRGPKIRPVGETTKAGQTVTPDIRSFMDLTRIPFDIVLTVANGGARSGLIRTPTLPFSAEPTLSADLRVSLRNIELKPQDSQTGSSGIENSVLLVPAYSVVSISFGCFIGILTWERLPPKDRFSRGCDIGKTHSGYFESKREEALKILSKLEQSRRLGSISVKFQVTESDLIGKFHWKAIVALSSLDLAIAEDFSLSQLKATVISWKYENQSSIYVNFLDYVENQGKEIRKTLENRIPDATSTAFPAPTSEDHAYARDVLCFYDPEFAGQWKKLSSLEGSWWEIIAMLKEQKRGRQLSERDDNDIRELQAALETVLQKCQVLRKKVVEDFKKKP